MEVKVVVATHKKYDMPGDEMYIPLHVGAEGKIDSQGNVLDLGYQKDNTGDNISELNSSFCELTGLYWAWKNLKSDYIGLVHYRRHFVWKKKTDVFMENVLNSREAQYLFSRCDVILPKPRKYYIETLYSHYAHTHYEEHLIKVREIIWQMYPEYINVYDKTVKQTYGYMFNMMIMKRELLVQYCEWLFPILFELKKCIFEMDDSQFQNRYFGRISEIIFNVWLNYQLKSGKIDKKRIEKVGCKYAEPVDWRRKVRSFLVAKFAKKKYDSSF